MDEQKKSLSTRIKKDGTVVKGGVHLTKTEKEERKEKVEECNALIKDVLSELTDLDGLDDFDYLDETWQRNIIEKHVQLAAMYKGFKPKHKEIVKLICQNPVKYFGQTHRLGNDLGRDPSGLWKFLSRWDVKSFLNTYFEIYGGNLSKLEYESDLVNTWRSLPPGELKLKYGEKIAKICGWESGNNSDQTFIFNSGDGNATQIVFKRDSEPSNEQPEEGFIDAD
jgi:hypothetical protein